MYNVPIQCRQHSGPLKTDIDEARKYFIANVDDQPHNARVLDKLFAHFLISHELFKRMSKLFQGLLRNLGTSVSGNEKQFMPYYGCAIKALSNRFMDVSTAGSPAW